MFDKLPAIDAPKGLYRERQIDVARTALLSIDMQNAEFSPERLARARAGDAAEARHRVFLERLATTVLPNQKRLQAAARAAGIEVIYTVIESLTRDGRDRSLDHKISRLHFPKGSWEAKVIADVAPLDDEIMIPKTASGIFNATNIEYVLRNLGVEFLVIYGVMTDQCVETTVRDAADRGFLVTQIEDACAAETEAGHRRSIEAMDGHYCRMRSTEQMVAEIEALGALQPGKAKTPVTSEG
jgi:ureidoacrylate peracid hydrolase